MKTRWLGLCCFLAAVLTVTAQSFREIPRGPGFPPRFHDPSTPIREGGKWWVFSTGVGIATRYSEDLKSWKEGPPVFKEFPSWHKEVVPSQRGHLWAPEVVWYKGVYRLYYSVSAFGKNTSAIGLVTSPSISPDQATTRWKDEGIVVQSKEGDPYNTIDPHVILDSDGRHWLSFGSFWTGIQLIELDPKTGKTHHGKDGLRRIAWNESIEAPAILKHGHGYYLFVNWGLCCRGVDSTYEIRVGRSRNITGPYVDKDGRDMATGGGTLLLGTRGDHIGPGHASFVMEGRNVRMFHHFYDKSRGGFASLGAVTLEWTKDGWPEVK